MPKNFIEELQWRGMIHDIMPGTEEALNKKVSSGYIGFDPTADSLHIGSLVQIMTLVHFQRAGHKPYALVGGATGMVGDPSGKSQERNLLDTETLDHNVDCVKKQLEQFLDFERGENAAEMVNNYDWFKEMNFLDFIRDIGKHMSVNYMMAKDSVKSRLETGMSFTEFSYQLVQGYDFYYLNTHKNCIVQLGGSDQWGNIVTGTELIRRKGGGEAFAVTTPLIKKADGTKFGKTEGGNVWLDAEKTSPYEFYQYWFNASDEDAEKYIKIFTLKSQEEIETLITEHKEAEYLRKLQKELAADITRRVHSEDALTEAIAVTNLVFGKATNEEIKAFSVPAFEAMKGAFKFATVSRADLDAGLGIIDALGSKTDFLASNGEARRELKGNAISVNKEKVNDQFMITSEILVHDKYVLLSKGKKNNYLLIVE
ncbi:tyrosine--tRNA ligase [Crocinitomicaceae bacterium]|nr:tyrosine--tRNA ligase [Crocinitomicaceae bacterium]MDC0099878.1 tyrosine--tRNA ligase [Crocinitomicaceae bacterium]|tara:strand:+ start:4768 stop:6048 length:1281 start_codon:yes stop_codon:yes gene_type:complete